MEYTKKLKELREDRDLNQKEIAELLNTTQSYYSQYENNKRPLPVNHLITLCKFYGVSADYILGLPDNSNYPKR